MKRKNEKGGMLTTAQLCLLAIAVCLNVLGSQIALMLRLPIYMDSIGSVLAGMLMGPLWGMVPSLLSSILTGVTTDVYALYFAPSGMLVGMITGILVRTQLMKKLPKLLSAFLIATPGIIYSAVICAILFDGVTSSGSMYLVQILAKTPLGMTGSVFAVQFLTEYMDRFFGLCMVIYLLNRLPANMRQKWERKAKGGIYYGSTGKQIQ